MMPLSLAELDTENTIRKIGGSPELRKHLENLGFVVGGNVIVKVKEARVAISEEAARRVMI